MAFSKTSKLQSTKSLLRNQINNLQKEIEVVRIIKQEAYEKAEKDSDIGSRAFVVLNQTREYDRHLKRLLTALSTAQRLVKRELSQ